MELGRVAVDLRPGRAAGRRLAEAHRRPVAERVQVGRDRLAVGRIGRVERDALAVAGQRRGAAGVAEQAQERRGRNRARRRRSLERQPDERRDRDPLPRRERRDRPPAVRGQDAVVVGRDQRPPGAGQDPNDGPRSAADRADVRADRPQPGAIPAERPVGGADLLDRQRVPVRGRDRRSGGDAADLVYHLPLLSLVCHSRRPSPGLAGRTARVVPARRIPEDPARRGRPPARFRWSGAGAPLGVLRRTADPFREAVPLAGLPLEG